MSATKLVLQMGRGWRPFTADRPLPLPCPASVNALAIKCCDDNASARPSFASILEELLGRCTEEAEEIDSVMARSTEASNTAVDEGARRMSVEVEMSSIFEKNGGSSASSNPLVLERSTRTPSVTLRVVTEI